MTKQKVSATLDEDMIKEIDRLRGMANRSPFLEMLIQKGLVCLQIKTIVLTKGEAKLFETVLMSPWVPPKDGEDRSKSLETIAKHMEMIRVLKELELLKVE